METKGLIENTLAQIKGISSIEKASLKDKADATLWCISTALTGLARMPRAMLNDLAIQFPDTSNWIGNYLNPLTEIRKGGQGAGFLINLLFSLFVVPYLALKDLQGLRKPVYKPA